MDTRFGEINLLSRALREVREDALEIDNIGQISFHKDQRIIGKKDLIYGGGHVVEFEARNEACGISPIHDMNEGIRNEEEQERR